MRRLPLLGSLLLALVLAACQTAPRPGPARTLILVSIDAFRWDYLDRHQPPHLLQLAADGVRVQRMAASFPTKTFPNHYTLATGLRPEHHGIVSNFFHDPDLGASFNKNDAADNADGRWWSGGEPIWITAEKAGIPAATVFFPGDEAPIQGRRARLVRGYTRGVDSAARVDTLLEWLARPPGERPRFAALYLEVVDNAGHRHGPDAPEVATAVREADAALGRLLDGLDRLGLRATTDLVIVSDHGLSATSTDRVVFFEDLADPATFVVESTGANGGVRPKSPDLSAAELAARMRAKAPPALQVYVREEVPAGLHYRASRRIPPVVLVADDGWMIESKVGWPAFSARYDRGNHGWDPAAPNMGAIFVASGPSFRRGRVLPAARNIDVYNLLCATLGLPPAPNDGGDALVRAVLAR